MNLKVCLILCLSAGISIFAQTSDRVTAAVNPTARIAIPNSVYPAVAGSASQAVDPAFPMEHMILTLQGSAAQRSALETLMVQQQDPASSNFHKFLTPAQFASAFGVSQNDLDKVTAWLTSNGFQVDEVQPNHLAIVFSGTAVQVLSAFNTEIRQYTVNGETHHANATAPQIPAALAPVILGLVKLNDFHSKSPALTLRPLFNSPPSSHYLVPADYAVIYNLNPLFTNGFTGVGQNIAIVGRSNVNPADITAFRMNYGLTANAFTPVYATGSDPGIATNGDQIEATLDVEWAGAVAPHANIKLVMAGSSASTDGVDLAAQYAVNHNVASILSVSFGACEAVLNNAFYNTLWQQAAAQGMSVFVAAGDSGAADCDMPSASTGSYRAVNGICSTPYNTCVGGTMFNDTANPGQYWLASNNAVMGSAISYIPEVVWNESKLTAGGAGLTGGGGGASGLYYKPFWQVAPGVPADNRRDVPDVSLSAAQHDGYVIVYGNANAMVSGTSAAAPSFAGIMALVTQKYGGAQGNVNATLYPLAARGTQAGSLPIFHDVTAGNNSVPGVTGYSATAGYDLASGLGSVDAANLVNNWGSLTGGFSLSVSALSVTAAPGHNGNVNLNVTDLGTFNSPVTLSISNPPPGVLANFAPNTLSATGTSVLTFAAAGSSVGGTYPLTVTATGGGVIRTVIFNLVVVVSTGCTLTALPASLTVVTSQSTSTKLVCGSAQGNFASSLVLSVVGAPAGVSTSFSPSLLAAGTGVSTLAVNTTSAAIPGTYNLIVSATLPGSSPPFATGLSIPVTINAPATFSVTLPSSSISFPQGGAGSIVLTSKHSGTFNSSISFSTSGLPSTISAVVSGPVAAPGDGSTTISLQSMSVGPVGTYTMTLLAQGGGLVLRIPITVQVTAAPAFSLTSSATVLTLVQSTATTVGTASTTFTTGMLTNGFNLPVSFSVGGLPAGVTAAWSAASIAAPGAGSSVLTLTASAIATTGVSTFTVTATSVGGTIARSVNMRLIVTPAPTFTISAPVPSYNMRAGGVLTETITAKGLYGYNSNIQLSAGLLPAGLGVTFQNTTISGLNGTTTMTILPLATLAAGPYTIVVTATDPITSSTQTTPIAVLVGNVTTTLSTPSLTVARTGFATATITTVATSFTGSVSLSIGNLPPGISYTLSNNAIAGSGTSTLTLSAAVTATPGTYTITVRSFAGGIATTIALTVIIT